MITDSDVRAGIAQPLSGVGVGWLNFPRLLDAMSKTQE